MPTNLPPEYFEADKPRLTAKWTEEMKSWWLQANNFSHILDLDRFLSDFFQKLDEEIEQQRN